MNCIYRKGQSSDLQQLKALALQSWTQFRKELTPDNWEQLSSILLNDSTYSELLQHSESVICETETEEIIGMAFIVPSGNPTELYDENWSYIRFVTVNPLYEGKGIGRTLTEKCIDIAKKNNEQIIALHTSVIMAKAIHIYENLGFEILREIKPRLGKTYWLYLLNLKQ